MKYMKTGRQGCEDHTALIAGVIRNRHISYLIDPDTQEVWFAAFPMMCAPTRTQRWLFRELDHDHHDVQLGILGAKIPVPIIPWRSRRLSSPTRRMSCEKCGSKTIAQSCTAPSKSPTTVGSVHGKARSHSLTTTP